MANVKIEMDKGELGLKGENSPEVRRDKVRKYRFADPEKRARLKELDAKKQRLAEKRGAFEDATPAQRREAKAVAEEIAAVKAEIVAGQQAAMEDHRARELAKQAAARKRELARSEKS